MKKSLSILLALLMTLGSFPVTAQENGADIVMPTPWELLEQRDFPFTDSDEQVAAIINAGVRDFADGLQGVKEDLANNSPYVDVEWIPDDGVGDEKGCVKITARIDRFSAQPVIVVRARKGMRYKLSFDAKMEQGANSLEAIFFHPAGSQPYDFPLNVAVGDSWQSYETTYTYNGNSPYDYTQIMLRLGSVPAEGDVTYFIDNFNLELLDPPDELEKKVLSSGLLSLKKEVLTPDFLDTKEHPAKNEIEFLCNYGIFMNDDAFRPDDALTEAEVTIIETRTDAALDGLWEDSPTRGEFAVRLFDRMQEQKQTVYYVDGSNGDDANSGTKAAPWRTLAKARDAVREKSWTMDEDIYVMIGGGTYYQEETLSFSTYDSGKNGYSVIYKAMAGEKPVISGAKKITGWQIHDRVKNIYKAPAGGIQTRLLYVNGVRANRAASTGGFADETLEPDYGHTTTDLSLLDFKRPQDLELTYRSVWMHHRAKVQSIEQDGDRVRIIMEPVTWNQICNGTQTSANRVDRYENAYELLDEEGEFYLDTAEDTFYYKPRSGEDLKTAVVEAGVLEQLVDVQDAFVEVPVRNLRFDGIVFNHTTWHRPDQYGYVTSQNNVISDIPRNEIHQIPVAAVHVGKSRNISFERCEFSRLGSNAITLDYGTQYSPIMGCEFTDISGGAVYVGTPQLEGWSRIPKGNMEVRSNHVENNLFHNIGVEYYEATAISVGFPNDMNIMYNEIYDMPYSGMHLGYGWHTIDTSSFSNVMVAYNYIYDVMKELRDGGAIYTLGRTAGKALAYDGEGDNRVIKAMEGGNYIFCNYMKDQWDHTAVLYNDQGSDFWNIQYNVIDQTEADAATGDNGATNWYMSNMAQTERNMLKNNYCTNQIWRTMGIEGLYEQAILFDNLNIPEEAARIMEATGRSEKYRDYSYDDFGYLRVPESMLLDVGEEFVPVLKGADAKAFPISLEGAAAQYQSGDNRIATVDYRNRLLALEQGITDLTISVTKDGVTKSAKTKLYVGDEFSKLSPTKKDYTVYVGNTGSISLAGTSRYGQQLTLSDVKFTSSDETVATIDAAGQMRGFKEGEIDVTAQATALGQTLSVTIPVSVTQFGDPRYLELPGYDISTWLANPSGWTDSLGKHPTPIEGGLRFAADSGQSIYDHKLKDELLDFNMILSPEASWPSIILRVTDKDADIWGVGNNMYIIVFTNGTIELHRFNDGQRTVIYGEMAGLTSIGGEAFPNGLFALGEEVHVQAGAIDETNGTRIILNINDINIFSFLDTEENRCAGEGYAGIISTSGTVDLLESK